MSQRHDRKLRQLYNRDVRNTAKDMGKVLGNHMRPKPRWVPWWVWMRLVRIVIRVK